MKYTDIIDEVTDTVAVIAIAGMVMAGAEPSGTVLGAITTIAVGKRVAKGYYQ